MAFYQIITSDYPSSSMAPNFAWNDIEEDYNDHQQTREFHDGSIVHDMPFYKNVQTTKLKSGDSKVSKSLHLRSQYDSNEQHTLSDTFHIAEFQSNDLEPRYSNQRFLQTQNLRPDALSYTSNQVDLIDIIGASQRYRMNEM